MAQAPLGTNVRKPLLQGLAGFPVDDLGPFGLRFVLGLSIYWIEVVSVRRKMKRTTKNVCNRQISESNCAAFYLLGASH